MLGQFVEFDHSQEVEAEHLVRPLRRFAPDPHSNQQAGDQRQIDLDFHTILARAQQVAAAQNALQPTEKQFDLPDILPP